MADRATPRTRRPTGNLSLLFTAPDREPDIEHRYQNKLLEVLVLSKINLFEEQLLKIC